ncbi:hypothetical protein E2C01_029727 [Portunus trituberculatus]|uniref:Uncharacterized protein n=1 Tax=Portunus trituberculatus TaxID=210409 RepID=A0A5B7ES90_PORTR|nr:hypothetical protein [Portunus trituberculatus]
MKIRKTTRRQMTQRVSPLRSSTPRPITFPGSIPSLLFNQENRFSPPGGQGRGEVTGLWRCTRF